MKRLKSSEAQIAFILKRAEDGTPIGELCRKTGINIRRACSLLRAERSSYHYRGKGADQAEPKQRINEIAETRVRYGYRRIHVLLRREGWEINSKRVYRPLQGDGSWAVQEGAETTGEGEVEGRPLRGLPRQ